MLWIALFTIGIAQGLFLIFLIIVRGFKNSLASRLISAMLLLMIFSHLGYLIIRTDLINYMPQLFGLQHGMMFLFGPLFYFYSKSVMDNTFHWKKLYWLHFTPYVIYLLISLPFLFEGKKIWIEFISTLLSGNLHVVLAAKVTFAVQNLQLLIYLIFTFRWIKSAKNNFGNIQYIVSVSLRIEWLTMLSYCFSIFFLTVFSLYIFILINGKYNPVTNYIYTLVTSGIIYFIAYKLVLNPELISPDFTTKYRTYMQFSGNDSKKYLQKLKLLMEETKIFMNPELNLSMMSEKLELPPHQVSKMINEKFGKSFNDYINEYRVQEFIDRINQTENRSYTIYGIALGVGFNSKSSFNNAFKKITGRTPSEYKIPS